MEGRQAIVCSRSIDRPRASRGLCGLPFWGPARRRDSMIRSARARSARSLRCAAGVQALEYVSVASARISAASRRRPCASSRATASSTARYRPGRTSETGSCSIVSTMDRPNVRGYGPLVPPGTTRRPQLGGQSPPCHPLRTSKPTNSAVAGDHSTWTLSTTAPGGPSWSTRTSRSSASRGPSATQRTRRPGSFATQPVRLRPRAALRT